MSTVQASVVLGIRLHDGSFARAGERGKLSGWQVAVRRLWKERRRRRLAGWRGSLFCGGRPGAPAFWPSQPFPRAEGRSSQLRLLIIACLSRPRRPVEGLDGPLQHLRVDPAIPPSRPAHPQSCFITARLLLALDYTHTGQRRPSNKEAGRDKLHWLLELAGGDPEPATEPLDSNSPPPQLFLRPCARLLAYGRFSQGLARRLHARPRLDDRTLVRQACLAASATRSQETFPLSPTHNSFRYGAAPTPLPTGDTLRLPPAARRRSKADAVHDAFRLHRLGNGSGAEPAIADGRSRNCGRLVPVRAGLGALGCSRQREANFANLPPARRSTLTALPSPSPPPAKRSTPEASPKTTLARPS